MSRRERQASRLERRPFGPRGERQDARRERREDRAKAKEDSEPDEAYLEARQTEKRTKKALDRGIRRAKLLDILGKKPDSTLGMTDFNPDFSPSIESGLRPLDIPESPDPTESMTDVEVCDVPSTSH